MVSKKKFITLPFLIHLHKFYHEKIKTPVEFVLSQFSIVLNVTLRTYLNNTATTYQFLKMKLFALTVATFAIIFALLMGRAEALEKCSKEELPCDAAEFGRL